MTTIDLDTLIGPTWDFYGIDNNFFKLDGLVLEAMEDPADGYRSALSHVRVAKDTDEYKPTFFTQPVAQVRLRDIENPERWGWELVDESGHIWLQIGTDYNDNYYPSFLFSYSPKEPEGLIG